MFKMPARLEAPNQGKKYTATANRHVAIVILNNHTTDGLVRVSEIKPGLI